MKNIGKKLSLVLVIAFMFCGAIFSFAGCSKPTFTVTYYAENKTTVITELEVEEGEEANFATTPTKASDETYDYVFAGWVDSEGNDMTESLQSVTSDLNVYASFNKTQHTFAVKFYAEDKTTLIISYDVAKGNTLESYPTNRTKADDTYYSYTFAGWVDEDGNDASTLLNGAINSDVSVYESFTKEQHTFKVNFYDKDKTTLVQSYDKKKNASISLLYTQVGLEHVYSEGSKYYVSHLGNDWKLFDGTDATEKLANVTENLDVYAYYEECDAVVVQNGITFEFSLTQQLYNWGYRVTGVDGTITNLTIPTTIQNQKVLAIGRQALKNNTKITSVTLPNTLETIYTEAFYGCTSLTSINIPDSVKQIEENAFSSSIKTLSLGAGITAFGEETIAYSPNIHYNSFAFDSIENLTISEDNEYFRAENNCIIDKEMNYLYRAGVVTTIPSSVTGIYSKAFMNSNIASITLPSTVVVIFAEAFKNCKNLETVILSEGLVRIWDEAFYECDALTSIYLPSSVTNIGEDVFFGCNGAMVIYSGATEKQSGWNSAFNAYGHNDGQLLTVKYNYTYDQYCEEVGLSD